MNKLYFGDNLDVLRDHYRAVWKMEQLRVSPKQKERARQIFMKSAQYAGFIDATTGRFVKPGIAQKDEDATQVEREAERGGGGGDGTGDL